MTKQVVQTAIHTKRTFGYAAAERMQNQRKQSLCCLNNGDSFGK